MGRDIREDKNWPVVTFEQFKENLLGEDNETKWVFANDILTDIAVPRRSGTPEVIYGFRVIPPLTSDTSWQPRTPSSYRAASIDSNSPFLREAQRRVNLRATDT